MSVEVADLYVTLRSISDPFSKGLKNAASDAESSSKRMTSALATVAKVGAGVAVGLTGIAVESVRMASTFNAQMTLLQTQAGVSKTQIASLSSGVLSLAGQVGFSPTSLAEALFHVESSFASTGISGSQALNLLKISAEGAATGHANLVDVTNALDAAVVSGIPGVSNLTEAMGELNATVGAGDMTMQDLANAFSTGLLANVKSYGLTFRDVGAALAVFGDNNMRGQIAATDLRMAVQAMAKPASTASVELRKMGLDTDSLAKVMSSGGLLPALQLLHERMTKIGVTAKDQGMVLTDLFGKKAGAGIVVLYDQLGRLESKYPDLGKGASGFADAWAATKATFAQQVKEIGSEADALAVRLGNALIPELTKLMSAGQGDIGQIAAGFSGAATQPVAHDNLHNALLNREAAAPPPLTGWQEFGEKIHRYLTDIEQDAKKLEPVGNDLLRFGEDAYQGLSKIVVAVEPVAKDLGGALFLGAETAGKALANVLGPAIKGVGDFIGEHQAAFRIFADVILGGLAVKMGVLGTINATKGLIELATRIVQFPVGQVGEITTAWKGMTAAWTGKEAAQGEQAVQGLAGAFGNLKTKAVGVLDKVLPDTGRLAGLAQMSKDFQAVKIEAEAADEQLTLFAATEKGIVQLGPHQQLSLFDEDLGNIKTTAANSATALEGTAGSGKKSATSMVGLAGALGKVAVPLGLVIGGAGLLGNYLGHLAGVGDHTAQSLDQLNQQLALAGGGSVQADQQFTRTATSLALAQSKISQLHGGINAFGTGDNQQLQGLKDVDSALASLATNGHADQAKVQFADIANSLAKQGIDAKTAASDFPQYEQAVKNAGDAAQTADGQVSGLQTTLSKQQALTQFQGDLSSLTQTVQANGKSLFDNTDMARANQQAMQMAAEQIESFYVQQRNAGVPINQATSDLQAQVDQLEQTGIQAGLTKSDVDKYLGTLGLIPSSIGTTITADIGPAMQQLGTLIEKIDSSTGVVQITGTGGGMYAGGRAYTNADGGPVRKGQLSWVGERGPELVVFGHDGYVVPNEALTGRRPLDSRVLSGAGAPGVGSAGYVPGFASGGASVVNNYYVTNHVAGTVLSQIELDALVRKLVQQHKTRNSTTGMN